MAALATSLSSLSIHPTISSSDKLCLNPLSPRTVNLRILGYGANLKCCVPKNKVLVRCNVWEEAESGDESSSAAAALKDELFVQFFRESWPYFLAHRGSTFVILISAELVDHAALLDSILMVLNPFLPFFHFYCVCVCFKFFNFMF